jgi:MoaA/NifB/PqqE/SkfB family radical SAM enzyme
MLINDWLEKRLSTLSPIRIIATVEAQCNLACAHCYWAHDLKEKSVLEWDTVVQKIASYNVDVAYAGRLLTKAGLSFINACVRHGVREMGIVDNGYTIWNADENLLRRFEYINISIDGWREQHDTQRGRVGSFDVAWESVLRLKEMGLDPIVATAISPITWENWDRFEGLLSEWNIPLSSTLVLEVPVVRDRAIAVLKTTRDKRRAFEILIGGMPKIVNIYELEYIKVLMPILKDFKWELDTFAGDSLVARLPSDTYVVYRPKSVQWSGELTLRWDGKFYPPVTEVPARPIDPDNPGEDFVRTIKEANESELRVLEPLL